MTIHRYEVITGGPRRRRWSLEEKRRIVAEAAPAEANASAVARRHGLHVSQLFRWRKELADLPAGEPQFLPVRIGTAPPVAAEAAPAPGVIEIALAGGHVVRVDRHVDAGALKRVVAVLEGS